MSSERKDWRPAVTSIETVMAEDWWECELPDGTRHTTRIRIGQPRALPDRDWYCPFQFSGYLPNPDPSRFGPWRSDGIRIVYGVGAVDALRNAAALIGWLFEGLEPVPKGGVRPSDAS